MRRREGSLFYKLLVASIAIGFFPMLLMSARLLSLNYNLLETGSEEWRLPPDTARVITDELLQEVAAYLTYSFMGIGILTLFLSGQFIGPIRNLQRYVESFGKGETRKPIDITTGDEVEQLANSFNTMAEDLDQFQQNLEAQVAERTIALERRALQLQAAASVSQAAASIRDLDELLTRVTNLIEEHFGYYHTGIFLLDAKSEYAILRAANSEGGKRMIASGHRLRLGETSIVGYVANTRQSRVALNVGADAVHFSNPYLPETRSEVALPLIVGTRLWGVLDVQSTMENAFIEDDVAILQILADQVAIAIENAQLFIENQSALTELRNALETSRKAFGDMSEQAWGALLQARTNLGYVCRLPETTGVQPGANEIVGGEFAGSADILEPSPAAWSADLLKAGRRRESFRSDRLTFVTPIQIRDHVTGAMRLRKSPGMGEWSDDEIALINTLIDQLGIALESARLYEDAQRRAERERLTSEITAKVRASNNPQVILQTAVSELRRALQAKQAQVMVYTHNKEEQEGQKPAPIEREGNQTDDFFESGDSEIPAERDE